MDLTKVAGIHSAGDLHVGGGVNTNYAVQEHNARSIIGQGVVGYWWNMTSGNNFPAGGGDVARAPDAITVSPYVAFAPSGTTITNGQMWPTGINTQYIYARFIGTLIAPETGTYTFGASSDDGFNLYVNGNLLISQLTTSQGAAGDLTYNQSATLSLNAGDYIEVIMEYHQGGGGYSTQLLWNTPSNTGTPTVLPFGPNMGIAGSNSNGNYTAYPDGTLITWGINHTTIDVASAQSGMYRSLNSNFIVTYPMAYAPGTQPETEAAIYNFLPDIWVANVVADTTSNTAFRIGLLSPVSKTAVAVQLAWVAVGVWH